MYRGSILYKLYYYRKIYIVVILLINMKTKITISLDQEVVNFIDQQKKDKPLSTFVNEILKEWVEYIKPNSMKGGNK